MNSPETDDLVGRVVLGRYRMVHRLAAGGMGIIYLARSEGAKGFIKPVVIKRILPHLVGDEALVGMFAREARIMSNLSHPGIVGILDFAEEEGAYLMVLEYVHGFHLGRWHRCSTHEESFCRRAGHSHLISVLDALHYAHTLTGPDGEPLHIVHRDISPGNVLIDTEGRIKLTDFGIARMRTDKTAASDKRALKGTFSYMAPELLKMVRPRTEERSLQLRRAPARASHGQERVLFERRRVDRLERARARAVARRQGSARRAARLTDVLKKALSKAPEERYADAHQFAQELRRVRGIAADDAARMLSEAATRDFTNPEMANSLKATDLATLDRKWREPGRKFSFRPSLKSIRVRLSEPATTPPTKVTTQALPQTVARRSVRKGVIVGTVAAVVAAGAATALALRHGGSDASPPGVILIEGSVAALGVAAQPGTPADPGAVVPVKAAEPAPSANAETPQKQPPPSAPAAGKAVSPKSRSELLTRAFARQQPQIARCFSQHASDVTGNPEISVRFEVGTDGHVTSAQVQPTALGATALGQCIAAIARATEFGPSPNRPRSAFPSRPSAVSRHSRSGPDPPFGGRGTGVYLRSVVREGFRSEVDMCHRSRRPCVRSHRVRRDSMRWPTPAERMGVALRRAQEARRGREVPGETEGVSSTPA